MARREPRAADVAYASDSSRGASTHRLAAVLLLVLASSAVLTGSAGALQITLLTSGPDQSIIQPLARGPTTPIDRVNAYIYELGEGASGTASSGQSTASAAWNLSASEFLITASLSRDPAGAAGLAQVVANIWFSVDQEIEYEIVGAMRTMDPVAGIVELVGFLQESPHSGNYAYYSRQDSRATPNESFSLGGTGGDFSNAFGGSPSGTLTAGVWYQLWFEASMETRFASAVPASGTAHLSLTFIPEPSTVFLLGLGILGIAAVNRLSPRRYPTP